MFTYRLFNLFVAVTLMAGLALTVQAAIANTNPIYNESKEQIQREYELGERYGETPQLIAQFSAEQIQREYWLGERYGVTPQGYARDQTLREYWLGERYGQTP